MELSEAAAVVVLKRGAERVIEIAGENICSIRLKEEHVPIAVRVRSKHREPRLDTVLVERQTYGLGREDLVQLLAAKVDYGVVSSYESNQRALVDVTNDFDDVVHAVAIKPS